MNDIYLPGMLVKFWPGAKYGPGKYAHVISDGAVQFGGTDCLRIRMADGGTDYIALTHIEVVA